MNQKGGVGKTTTALNLAHALALSGARVMALDMDPQGHLGKGFGLNGEAEQGLDEVLLDGTPFEEAVIETRERLRLAPAGERLAEVEMVAQGGASRGFRLHQALDGKTGDVDFVFIDCPPSAGLLSMNALFAVEEVVVPVSSDYLALHGVSRFMMILQHIEQALNRKMKVWIALTRYQERRRLARDVRTTLTEYFPGRVLATPVRESAALAECPGHGKTIFEYQRGGNGAADYRQLADDLATARTV